MDDFIKTIINLIESIYKNLKIFFRKLSKYVLFLYNKQSTIYKMYRIIIKNRTKEINGINKNRIKLKSYNKKLITDINKLNNSNTSLKSEIDSLQKLLINSHYND